MTPFALDLRGQQAVNARPYTGGPVDALLVRLELSEETEAQVRARLADCDLTIHRPPNCSEAGLLIRRPDPAAIPSLLARLEAAVTAGTRAAPVNTPIAAAGLTTLALATIRRGDNDRTVFDEAALAELARSLAVSGLLQPILVRPSPGPDGTLYEIIAGERRFRAAKLLGWSTIPAMVADRSDAAARLDMLVENIVRADLDPIDEAAAYAEILREDGLSTAELGARTGKRVSTIRARLALLRLDPTLQEAVRKGILTNGYAQALAESSLDHNRQVYAFGLLRDHAAPTPGWWQATLGAIEAAVAQLDLFGGEDWTGAVERALCELPEQTVPALPGVDRPPGCAGDASAVLTAHAAFWQRAAERWAAQRMPAKRQQCQAAVAALQAALAALGGAA